MVFPVANFIKLETGATKRMLFDRWWFEDRKHTDPKSRMIKTSKVMVFHAIEEDGAKVDKIFSVLSYKLQESLAPYVETGQIFTRHVEITKQGEDYATDYAFRLV